MTPESWPARAAQTVPLHGLSLPEYYLMGTAHYRIPLERPRFVRHAAWEFEGGDWPVFTFDELDAALTRLIDAGLMAILTEGDFEQERARRAVSALPEVGDLDRYRPGHVDFTERGYLLCREVTAPCWTRSDSGGPTRA
jgi:hypothetical protein